MEQGKADKAITLYQQSLAIAEQTGDAKGQSDILHHLAILKFSQGDLDKAIELFDASLAIEWSVSRIVELLKKLDSIVSIAEQQNDLTKALAYREESLTMREQIKAPDLEQARAAVEDLKRRLEQP